MVTGREFQIRWTDLDTQETGLVLRDGKEPTRGTHDRLSAWAARFNANSEYYRCEVEPFTGMVTP